MTRSLTMKKILSIAETLRKPAEGKSVKASADALYDENKGELAVHLNLSDPESYGDVVRMKLALEEADPATREVFRSWIRRLVKQGTVLVQD